MITVNTIFDHSFKEGEYALVRICYKKITRFIIYVRFGEDHAMEMIDGSEKDVTALFERIVTGQAKPEHLSDIADDYKREAYVM